METHEKRSILRDILGIAGFILLVIVGVFFIHAFIFRSFGVTGPSMEKTMYTDDRVIVNRLPVTWDTLFGRQYNPGRGQIIVFKNPLHEPGMADEFIVKRVIAFEGERVTVSNGVLTVYNKEHPDGFRPDDTTKEPGQPTTGDVDIVVPDNELFVAGDHRTGSYSLDSRNGLGTIPLENVIGPVGLRIYPFDKIRFF
ncbi:MAG TPA: signal peptidase I [Verrucomicrobiae bacterium]|nr:signal peptidase I [Verrucomicrobiae bacterium]